jgi:hypothetical protein
MSNSIAVLEQEVAGRHIFTGKNLFPKGDLTAEMEAVEGISFYEQKEISGHCCI